MRRLRMRVNRNDLAELTRRSLNARNARFPKFLGIFQSFLTPVGRGELGGRMRKKLWVTVVLVAGLVAACEKCPQGQTCQVPREEPKAAECGEKECAELVAKAVADARAEKPVEAPGAVSPSAEIRPFLDLNPALGLSTSALATFVYTYGTPQKVGTFRESAPVATPSGMMVGTQSWTNAPTTLISDLSLNSGVNPGNGASYQLCYRVLVVDAGQTLTAAGLVGRATDLATDSNNKCITAPFGTTNLPGGGIIAPAKTKGPAKLEFDWGGHDLLLNGGTPPVGRVVVWPVSGLPNVGAEAWILWPGYSELSAPGHGSWYKVTGKYAMSPPDVIGPAKVVLTVFRYVH